MKMLPAKINLTFPVQKAIGLIWLFVRHSKYVAVYSPGH